jgi:hypothetical protein
VAPSRSLADIEVWKTPDGEPYATLRLDGHFEHWPIASPLSCRMMIGFAVVSLNHTLRKHCNRFN